MPNPDDQACHDIAKQIEQANPRWIVVFGVFTKEFVGFPRFPAPAGTVIAALYPEAMSARMHEAERLVNYAARSVEA
jgi:hypothetical protein